MSENANNLDFVINYYKDLEVMDEIEEIFATDNEPEEKEDYSVNDDETASILRSQLRQLKDEFCWIRFYIITELKENVLWFIEMKIMNITLSIQSAGSLWLISSCRPIQIRLG